MGRSLQRTVRWARTLALVAVVIAAVAAAPPPHVGSAAQPAARQVAPTIAVGAPSRLPLARRWS